MKYEFIEVDEDITELKYKEKSFKAKRNIKLIKDFEEIDRKAEIDFILDLKKLQYTSSAGLRVILVAQKTMNKQGKMILKNVAEAVMEVFDMTGLTDLLSIE